MMNFIEAVKELKKGRKVRCPEMADSTYIVLRENEIIYQEYDGHNASLRLAVHADAVLRDDWEIYNDEFLVDEVDCYYRSRGGNIFYVHRIDKEIKAFGIIDEESYRVGAVRKSNFGGFIQHETFSIHGRSRIGRENGNDLVYKIGKELPK